MTVKAIAKYEEFVYKTPNNRLFYTPKQIAALIGFSERWVRVKIAEEKIESVRFNNAGRIHKRVGLDSLISYIKKLNPGMTKADIQKMFNK